MTDLPENKEDAEWRPTNEWRVVPIKGAEILGKMNHDNGIFKGTIQQRFRPERKWIRIWAEVEWR
jgi:hypothetical protein